MFGEIVFLIKESMIVSSNTKISRTFLCDELVQPDATDPSICEYQDSQSHCSCQIRTCMSQYDSMQLMDDRLSLLYSNSLLQNLTPLWQGRWKPLLIHNASYLLWKKVGGKGRKLSYALYFHWGKPVCHRIAKTQLVNLARDQRDTGLTGRQKASGLRKKRAIIYNQRVAAHPFVKNNCWEEWLKAPW